MNEPRAMQDGPNTHHYRTFTKGTSFHVVTVDYADGERHTFHVPSEVVNQLDADALRFPRPRSRPSLRAFLGRLLP